MNTLDLYDWLLLAAGVVMLCAMPFIVRATKKSNKKWMAQKRLDDAAFEKLRQDFLKVRL
jgi:hypothetical protein